MRTSLRILRRRQQSDRAVNIATTCTVVLRCQHEKQRDTDGESQAFWFAAAYDEPFGNSSVIRAYLCAKMAAAEEVDQLLARDGSDELFAGNARYAKQLLFEHYGRVPRALLQQQPYGRIEGVSALKRMLYLDWQQTLADSDLRKVRYACELAGVDVALPMLHANVAAPRRGSPLRQAPDLKRATALLQASHAGLSAGYKAAHAKARLRAAVRAVDVRASAVAETRPG